MFGRKEEGGLTEPEGFCGIAAVAVYSDGVLTAEEDDLLVEALLGVDHLGGLDEAELRDALVKVSRIAQREGDGHLLREAVAAIAPARREDAFRLAAELICADGEIDEEEREFLRRFERALGMTHEQAKRVIEALAG